MAHACSWLPWRLTWPGPLCAALAVALPAGAEPTAADKASCVRAYEQAQRLRKAAKLVAAEEQLSACKAACPAALRVDCDQWEADNRVRIATLAITAQDREGHAISDVRVIVDEELRAQRLDGEPLAVDPGNHVLRFERDSGAPVTERVSLREGERNHAIAIRFDAPGAPAPPVAPPAEAAPTRGPSAAVYVSGAVGVLGLVGLVVFGVRRANDISTLDRCKPSCLRSDVDGANLDLYMTGGSLLLAVAGVGLAAYLQWGPMGQPAPGSTVGAPRGLVVAIAPERSGVGATLSGSF
jgi:hypothetical protein